MADLRRWLSAHAGFDAVFLAAGVAYRAWKWRSVATSSWCLRGPARPLLRPDRPCRHTGTAAPTRRDSGTGPRRRYRCVISISAVILHRRTAAPSFCANTLRCRRDYQSAGTGASIRLYFGVSRPILALRLDGDVETGKAVTGTATLAGPSTETDLAVVMGALRPFRISDQTAVPGSPSLCP